VAGVVLLFLLAFRRLATAPLALVPLGVGLALTLGFAALVLGALNSATSGFSALLVGLGIDFTIASYSQYVEARAAGRSTAAALGEVPTGVGPAIVLGALTTVGTFYAFLATRFTGLRQFGLLTGTGIVFMMVGALLVLPALIVFAERRAAPPRPPTWLDPAPLLEWAAAHERAVLIGAGALTAAAFVALSSLRFDEDPRNLRSPSKRGLVVQDRITAVFGQSFRNLTVRIDADDVPTVLERAQTLVVGLRSLAETGTIASVESIASLVPPRAEQERVLAWVTVHRALADTGRVAGVLRARLAAHGLAPSAFNPGLAALSEALRPTQPVSVEMWRGTPVQELVERSLRTSPHGAATAVTVMTRPGDWRRETPPKLEALVRSVPGAKLTGINLVARRLRVMGWQDAALAGGLGLVLVCTLLAWRFRRFVYVLTCLVPVVAGVVWALALMAVAGAPLNLLNVFVITMIIGISSDYAIYILQRRLEGAAMAELAQTARAVVLAALTTVVGFGTLITTHYPGLRSMGWMAASGVISAALAAVVVEPVVARRAGRGAKPDP